MNLKKIKIVTLIFLFGMIFSAIATPILAYNPDANYPSDLLAYWKFDDRLNPEFQELVGVGLVGDETTYNNFGELNGDASLTIDGKIDDAVEFDGSGDYILISNNPVLNQTVFSVLLWVNFADITPAGDMMLVAKVDYMGADGWTFYYDFSADQIVLWVRTTNGVFQSAGIPLSSMTQDTWHYICATFDGTKTSVYLDGEIEDSQAVTGDFLISEDLMSIGGLSAPSSFEFEGRMDEIALYNRSLSEAEILDRYTNGVPEEEIPFDWTTLIFPTVVAGGIILAVLVIFFISRRETGVVKR